MKRLGAHELLVAIAVLSPTPGYAQSTATTAPSHLGLRQLGEVTMGRDDPSARSSCGSRVNGAASGTTTVWTATCSAWPSAPTEDANCRELLRANLHPHDGLEVALVCDDAYFLVTDAGGTILADLGRADMLWQVNAIQLLGQTEWMQLWIRFDGDSGYDVILSCDPATWRFTYIFTGYRSGGYFAIRFDDSSEIETCAGYLRWNRSRFEYATYRRHPQSRRRCAEHFY